MADLDIPPSASLVRVQNLVLLAKHLRLPLAYKVYERKEANGSEGRRSFLVIVHVRGDQAFKKYLFHASKDDLPLFRGLLLTVEATPSLDRILSAGVQQAFLPKFENEGQDAQTAAAITEAAGQRYMVVTVKHSGSLTTLSGAMGFAAKNSINNTFTAGAALLLRAHYCRLYGEAEADGKLQALMSDLWERRLAVAFEMVTGSHGHHGQLPAAEYLVATAAHSEAAAPLGSGADHHTAVNNASIGGSGAEAMDVDGIAAGAGSADGCPKFLPWHEFLVLCLRHGLPLNDVWLIAGRPRAEAARQLLDDLALRGGPTGAALEQLTHLTADGAADGCVHLPGTYPHAEWQGSRIEGFVVAQGEEVSPAAAQRLAALQAAMAAQRLPLAATPPHLRTPYADLLKASSSSPSPSPSPPPSPSRSPLPSTAAATAKAGSAAAPASPRRTGSPGAANTATTEDATATAGSWGGTAAEKVVSAISEVCQPWLSPAASTAAYATAPAAVREAVIQALTSMRYSGTLVPQQDDTSGTTASAKVAGVYSRAELAAGGLEGLIRILDAEVVPAEEAAAAVAMSEEGVVGNAAARLEELKKVLEQARAAATTSSAGQSVEDLLEPAMRALAGAADISHTLRYKKKMMMWQLPGTGGTDEGVVGYCMMTFVIRNGLGALKLGEGTYLGYVEGLARRSWQLPQAQVAQMLHFARCWVAWVTRHAASNAPQGSAGSKAGSGKAGGKASKGKGSSASPRDAIDSDSYLDLAEPFAKAFLESNGGEGMVGNGLIRPPDAFQGVLMLVDCEPAWAISLCKALHLKPPASLTAALAAASTTTPSAAIPTPAAAGNTSAMHTGASAGGNGTPAATTNNNNKNNNSNKKGGKKGGPAAAAGGGAGGAAGGANGGGAGSGAGALGDVLQPFTRAQVPGGVVVAVVPEQPLPKGFKEFAKEAAPFIHVVVMRPAPDMDEDNTPAAKKRKGLHAGKVKQLEACVPPERMLEVRASTPMEEAVRWAGSGTPLPKPDPAIVACFVTIPGVGKTALARAIAQGPKLKEAQAAASSAANGLTIKLLNSDTMKKQRKQGPDRYWNEVGAAALEQRGSGHRLVVLADKNLVPYPADNVVSRLRMVTDGGSGAHTVAVLPVCRGPTSSSRPDAGGLYTSLQALPFPLELITLCMDRVLRRKQHEGNLDGETLPSAARVVALFAALCRNVPKDALVETLQENFSSVLQLEVMRGDAAGKVPLDVLRHVAQGLRDCDVAGSQRNRRSEVLPDAWEVEARQLLARVDTQAALRELEVPLDECVAQLAAALDSALNTAARLHASDSETTAAGQAGGGQLASAASMLRSAVADLDVMDGGGLGSGAQQRTATPGRAAAGKGSLLGPGGKAVRYFGLFGFDDASLKEEAAEILQEELQNHQADANGALEDKPSSPMKPPAANLRSDTLHVTLWHAKDTRAASGGEGGSGAFSISPPAHTQLGRMLLERIGTPLEAEAVALYVSPEVTAAEVVLSPTALEALGLPPAAATETAAGGPTSPSSQHHQQRTEGTVNSTSNGASGSSDSAGNNAGNNNTGNNAGSDDNVPRLKPFLHVTLAVASGHNPADSNQLPGRFAAGDPAVRRVVFPGGPLVLQGGQLLAVEGDR